ncbi:DUF6880 family protein [Novosphingobium sp. KN65.2]|uniref:DUF6880 family protein n=1 Tax=Novosphingobium sp. KN65.2 TaxID=1478134 RepID=UPI0005DE6B45|nr:DUF6880 family protein [Novosphingobium sp. KN65.2]CDO37793.1 conserved hypothetical protein [Novosphingobium sp. KN65.2]
MARSNTLNTTNLAALGAERLAALLIELAQGDAAMKRRLRLELASQGGGGDVAAEVRKRLVAIARARGFVDWRKIRSLGQDLETQRAAIMAHVAPDAPSEAFDLLWRMLEMAPSIYERCDDSNGIVSGVLNEVLTNLGEVAVPSGFSADRLAERVLAGTCANDYGQFDDLISLMAPALGQSGLAILKAKFEDLAKRPPVAPKGEARGIIGYGLQGPVYEDDYKARNHARLVKRTLAEIADASGDVDGFVALQSDDERTNPAIAAQIARRLLDAGRADEALAALDQAPAEMRDGGRWPEWPKVRIDALEAAGRSETAQRERWEVFERTLNAEYLKAYIKQLPDFDDMEAEERALDHARAFHSFHQALAFLVEWPALDAAAELILARPNEIDGDHYWLLTPAAEVLEPKHPLAATLLLRAMIDFALDRARAKRYPHAARHLQTCAYLAGKIEAFGDHADHEAYAGSLKAKHGRKSGFWSS